MRHKPSLPALGASLALLLACCGRSDREAYVRNPAETAPGTDVGSPFAEWDVDHSDSLDRTEFDAWWKAVRARTVWSVDDAPGLTRDQFEHRVFKKWDRNGDGLITESEWREGVDLIWGRPQGTWSDWDRNGDAQLDFEEVKDGLEQRGLYEQVDTNGDGVIDDKELAAWLFNVFDADRDGKIDRTEWESTWFASAP